MQAMARNLKSEYQEALSSNDLKPVQPLFCNGVKQERIAAVRNGFLLYLLSIVRITVREAISMANFFFADLLGPSVEAYLSEIPRGYEIAIRAVEAPGALAAEETARFSYHYGTESGHTLFTIASAFRFHILIRAVAYNTSYKKECLMIQALRNNDSHSIGLLKRQGLDAGPDGNWKSAVSEHYSRTEPETYYAIDRKRKRSTKGSNLFVKKFGLGILAFWLPKHLRCVDQWGHVKTEAALRYIQVKAPWLRIVCDVIDEQLRRPISMTSRAYFPQINAIGSILEAKLMNEIREETSDDPWVEKELDGDQVEESSVAGEDEPDDKYVETIEDILTASFDRKQIARDIDAMNLPVEEVLKEVERMLF
ncbi:MAG: hypothetical protein Q9160_008991 [Pyrenula sp. 1 TL-2023]